MGRRILVQRRGKGTQNFRSPKHRKRGAVKYIPRNYNDVLNFEVIEFIHEGGRGTPLARIEFDNKKRSLWLPPEGIFLHDRFQIGPQTEIMVGNTMEVQYIPEGSLIYNIEILPGDGGKLCRSGGTTATLMTRSEKGVQILFPSGKRKVIHKNSRATLGVVAGGGRTTKPYLKAGNKYHQMRTKATNWPVITSSGMNACSHPFGGGRKKMSGRPTTTSRNAPPGRKVGMIAARQSGRKTR
ncbi:50S ribosomal protein L2 [Candidatus Lokiarchaeum ossiferum]|uniref:Large ribosomal subunit protein uL2 n=1 Tax=Candidatus Lokiarchaeum ossiferum TaxID=2951803 RepID=A0ABY6HRV1_9ARCH|nr:50S ribosomal protein L2 [Candidatus Lokiarchaeum sp. B-35]